MRYLGDILKTQTVDFFFNTQTGDGLAATLMTPSISAYKGFATIGSATGLTLMTNFSNIVGLHEVNVSPTISTWYTNGDYTVVLNSGYVGSISVGGRALAQFSIENRSSAAKLGTPSYTTVTGDLSTLYTTYITGVASINNKLGYGVASVNTNLGYGVASINSNTGGIASISTRIGSPANTDISTDISGAVSNIAGQITSINSNVNYVDSHLTSQDSTLTTMSSYITLGVASVNKNLGYGVASVNTNLGYGVASVSNKLGNPFYTTISADIAGIPVPNNAGIASISARLGTPAHTTIAGDISNISITGGSADNAGIASISARLGTPSYFTIAEDIHHVQAGSVVTSNPAGTGSVTYAVQYKVNSSPVKDVEFWVTPEADLLTMIAGVLLTDSNGYVTFYLDPGNYNLHWQKYGLIPANHKLITVS